MDVNEASQAEISSSDDAGRSVGSQLRTGARASIEELSALYHDGYHRFVRVAEAITHDSEEARDAVQEGFSNALHKLDHYKGRGSFEGWVWRCVLNAARMSRRKSARRASAYLGESAVTASETTQAEPKLLEQIARLPERQRLVLFLRYFADLPYDGIAETLKVSPGTVAAALHTAQRTLRRRLEEAEND